MKFTQLGGATAIIEHQGVRLLCDPWLDDGIFHGSWFHYPPAPVTPEDIGRVDLVYISHIHEDHCSAGTIAHLNRDAEIIIMDREPNLVARFLAANHFDFHRVHRVKPRTPVEIRPGLVVDMIEADPANEIAHVIDSALVLRWDGRTVYDANDCQPYPAGIAYLKSQYGRIDLALLPYSGGSGYPSCYVNLSDAEKTAEKQRIMRGRLASFADTVAQLDPTWAAPFADQYVVGGSRSSLNAYVSHPPGFSEAGRALQERGLGGKALLLNPGQSFDLDTQTKEPAAEYRSLSEEDRSRYIDGLAGARYDHEAFAFNPWVSVERLVRHARARLWQAQQRRGLMPSFSFYLDVPEAAQRFRIRLEAEGVEVCAMAEPLAEPFLRMSCPRSLMIMLLLGHVSWNIADAALFIDYERRPNRYDPQLYVLLNFLTV